MDNVMMISKLANALNFYKIIENEITKDANNDKHLGLGTKNATHYYKQIVKYTRTLKPAIINDVYNYYNLMEDLKLTDMGIVKFNKNGKAYVRDYTDDDNDFLCYGDLFDIISGLESTITNNILSHQIANKESLQNA